MISIHTPARGVTQLPPIIYWRCLYFNPHSRKGSDTKEDAVALSGEISIHTPARGVTFDREYFSLLVSISIHTPARGVTHIIHQRDSAF